MSIKIISILILIQFSVVTCKNKNTYQNLEKTILSKFEKIEGDFALAFKNLDDDKLILINENEIFHAASTIKTPVMIELFKQSNLGKISLKDTLLIKNQFKSIVDGSFFELSEFEDSDANIYKKNWQIPYNI